MRNASVFIVWEIKIEKKKYTTKVGRQSSGRRKRQSPACVEGRLGGESKPKRRGGYFLSFPHCSVHFPWALCFVVPPSFLTPSSGSSHPPVAHLPKALQCLLLVSTGLFPHLLHGDPHLPRVPLAVDLISSLSFPRWIKFVPAHLQFGGVLTYRWSAI